MVRTIVITGSASGIGRETTRLCREAGDRVIGVDLKGADVEADLATPQGRAAMVEAVTRLAPDGIDGLVAGAGISRGDMPAETLAINFFGAVATLEGLRPLLARGTRPRAVAICSTAAILSPGGPAVEACLAGNEAEALDAIRAAPQGSYAHSKRALSLWMRRAAVQADWAGSGIALNGIGPGVTLTPMTTPLLDDPEMVKLVQQSNPIATAAYAAPEEIAEVIRFMLTIETPYMVGQLVFVDGGSDALLRPDTI